MRHRVLPLAICVLAAACTSTPRPAGVTKADVDVRLMNQLFFSSAGTAAATFEVRITNTAPMPILIHGIRLSSPGMVQYTLRAEEKLVRETVEPGDSVAVSIPATLFGNPGATINEEPLAIRVFLDFEANGARHTDLFNILNVTE